MNAWETITGILVFLIGIALFWQSYNTSVSCNSIGGQISMFFTSLVGGTGAQMCYNSVIIEVGSVIAAIIGVVVIYASFRKTPAKRR